MKIALINCGNNVSGYKTVASAETLYIADILRESGYEVDVISMKDTEFTTSYENAKDPNYYDKLLVVNGSINFFGGKENFANTYSHRFMARYRKKIYYLLTDNRLAMTTCWPAVAAKPFHVNYKEEEFTISSTVKVISQGKDLETAKKLHSGKGQIGLNLEFEHFPLERYKIYRSDFAPETDGMKFRDLIYGGSFRAGIREEKMVKYLFDNNLDTEFFGTAKASQFKNKKFPWEKSPEFTGKVSALDVSKRNSTGIATIIIGDQSYNNNVVTLRVWESLASSAVTFFDIDFDTDMKIMKGNSFFYVSSKEELKGKIERLKLDDAFRTEMLEYQRSILKDFLDQKEEWIENFKKVLEINN